MSIRRYTITGLFGAVLISILVVQDPAAQALAASSNPAVGSFYLGVVDVAKKKKCTKCGKSKPLESFHRCTKVKGGKQAQCAECTNEQCRKYRKANPAKRLETQRKYRAANKEKISEHRAINRDKIREWQRNYYIANRENLLEKSKKHRIANRKKIQAYKKKYYLDNRERFHCVSRRRRALKHSISEHFRANEIRFVCSFWDNKCAICGKTKKQNGRALSIDHWRPLIKGNPLTMFNAVLLCRKHNSQKGANQPTDVFDVETVKRIEGMLKNQVDAWARLVAMASPQAGDVE